MTPIGAWTAIPIATKRTSEARLPSGCYMQERAMMTRKAEGFAQSRFASERLSDVAPSPSQGGGGRWFWLPKERSFVGSVFCEWIYARRRRATLLPREALLGFGAQAV